MSLIKKWAIRINDIDGSYNKATRSWLQKSVIPFSVCRLRWIEKQLNLSVQVENLE